MNGFDFQIRMTNIFRRMMAAMMVFGLSAVASAENGVTSRHVDIWSDGTRMSGDLFRPTEMAEGDKLPGIVLSHGWGGVRSHLNGTYAPKFAAAGFVVLTFDYRGWGDSDPRLVIRGEIPAPDEAGEATIKVQMLKEVVNPDDHIEDLRAAIDFLVGEPSVDVEKIGLWGTSFGGGHVTWTAAHDPRIDAIVSQVGAMNTTLAMDTVFAEQGGSEYTRGLAIQRARGEIDPVPQGNELPGLRGSPVLERVGVYRAIDTAHQIRAATLIIDAGKEELFDISENGRKVYDIVKENAPAKYQVYDEITHYQIYGGGWYAQASDLALEWFVEHLKGDE